MSEQYDKFKFLSPMICLSKSGSGLEKGDKFRSPDTNRMIDVGGPAHKKLLKKCKLIDPTSPIPENMSEEGIGLPFIDLKDCSEQKCIELYNDPISKHVVSKGKHRIYFDNRKTSGFDVIKAYSTVMIKLEYIFDYELDDDTKKEIYNELLNIIIGENNKLKLIENLEENVQGEAESINLYLVPKPKTLSIQLNNNKTNKNFTYFNNKNLHYMLAFYGINYLAILQSLTGLFPFIYPELSDYNIADSIETMKNILKNNYVEIESIETTITKMLKNLIIKSHSLMTDFRTKDKTKGFYNPFEDKVFSYRKHSQSYVNVIFSLEEILAFYKGKNDGVPDYGSDLSLIYLNKPDEENHSGYRVIKSSQNVLGKEDNEDILKKSPKRKSQSPKRKSQSPKRKSRSPKRKSRSPKRKSQSPKKSPKFLILNDNEEIEYIELPRILYHDSNNDTHYFRNKNDTIYVDEIYEIDEGILVLDPTDNKYKLLNKSNEIKEIKSPKKEIKSPKKEKKNLNKEKKSNSQSKKLNINDINDINDQNILSILFKKNDYDYFFIDKIDGEYVKIIVLHRNMIEKQNNKYYVVLPFNNDDIPFDNLIEIDYDELKEFKNKFNIENEMRLDNYVNFGFSKKRFKNEEPEIIDEEPEIIDEEPEIIDEESEIDEDSDYIMENIMENNQFGEVLSDDELEKRFN